MLRFVDRSPRSFFLKAAAVNLFIAAFITGVLMMRSDDLSWSEFFNVISASLVYTMACGMLTSFSFYFGERQCGGLSTRSRVITVLVFCLISGVLGHLAGSTIAVLLQLRGHGSGDLSFESVSQRVRDHLVFMPLTAMVTLVFGSLVYGFEMLMRRLENAIGRLKEQEVQAERLLKLKAEADLKALQARINPHFLFNTLNSIASLISENQRKAEEVTEKLSSLFRYTLNADRSEKVTLEQELHILQSYIDIEQLRVGPRLQVTIDVDRELHSLRVPPLLLQPLLENSIKYGVAVREEGGSVTVSGRMDSTRCVLEVSDDGPGFGDGTLKGAGHALENIRQRLDLLYGSNHHFAIFRENSKTVVRIEIPIAAEERPA